ncbi:MAG: TMEM143 family protein [Candidatus Competibacterales bacterium]
MDAANTDSSPSTAVGATHPDLPLESHIPLARWQLVDKLLAEGRLSAAQQNQFRQFAEIFAAYQHFRYHHSLETLKRLYQPLNPDADTVAKGAEAPPGARDTSVEQRHHLEQLLGAARYVPLTAADLRAAVERAGIVALRTEVDTDDFKNWRLFGRGLRHQDVPRKKWGFWPSRETQPVYERLVLAVWFKSAEAMAARGRQLKKLPFIPGKCYLYLYKDIPKYDLEILFPNLRVRMAPWDQWLLVIPALGAMVALAAKVLPHLLLIAAALVVLVAGQRGLSWLGLDDIPMAGLFPVIAAALTLSMTLGGFAARQYGNYQKKRLTYLKRIADTLFFRSLATNESVVYALVDEAEEAAVKEALLVYYHLITSEEPLTAAALDARVETWLHEELGVAVDFDIDDVLHKLRAIESPALARQWHRYECALLTQDPEGFCRPLALEEANHLLDYLWDHLFLHANGQGEALAWDPGDVEVQGSGARAAPH